MSWELFEKIIFQIREDARVIQLYWMGESFFHPQLIDMIKLCKAKTSAKVMLSTNGSILKCDIIDAMLKSGIDEVIISLDAADEQKIYEVIRVGGHLASVNSNVEYLLSKNNNRVHIVLQFIDMFINRSEREIFKQKWIQANCTVSIQCLYTWSNQIPSLNLASDNLSPVVKKERVPCADLWNKVSIHWDGNVSACCFDWHSTLLLGDTNKESLIDIWNGESAKTLREMHCSGKYSDIPLCKECDAWAEPDEYHSLFHME